MTALKNKEQNPTQLRASLAHFSQQQQFGGALNSSQISGLNTSQLNRNSNIKKVIRGGQGSTFLRNQRSSTMVGDMAQMLAGGGADRIRASLAQPPSQNPFEKDQADVDYVQAFFDGTEDNRQSNSSYMVRKDE